MVLLQPVVIGLRPSGFRDELDGWVRDLGYETFVTDEGRTAVEWVRRTPRTLTFLDVDLERVNGEDVWRLVRRIVDRTTAHPSVREPGVRGASPGWNRCLVLMAARRTNDVWFTALSEGVGTVLPLPSERDVVLAALRVAGRP